MSILWTFGEYLTDNDKIRPDNYIKASAVAIRDLATGPTLCEELPKSVSVQHILSKGLFLLW